MQSKKTPSARQPRDDSPLYLVSYVIQDGWNRYHQSFLSTKSHMLDFLPWILGDIDPNSEAGSEQLREALLQWEVDRHVYFDLGRRSVSEIKVRQLLPDEADVLTKYTTLMDASNKKPPTSSKLFRPEWCVCRFGGRPTDPIIRLDIACPCGETKHHYHCMTCFGVC